MDIDMLDSPFPPTIPELEEALEAAFPNSKVNRSSLRRQTILVRHGMVMAIVQLRGNVVRVKSWINGQNVIVLISALFGVLYGIVGVLVVALILYLRCRGRASLLEEKVSNFLKNHLNGNQDVSEPDSSRLS